MSKSQKNKVTSAAKLVRENDDSSSEDCSSTDSPDSPVDDVSGDPSFVCDETLIDNLTDRTTRATRRRQTRSEEEISSEEEGEVSQSPATNTTNTEVTQSPSTSSTSTAETQSTYTIPVITITADMNEEAIAAFKMMSDSFKEIGIAAKQNSTNFLGDIPFYGVSKDFDNKKNIIPLNEPTRFLDIVDLVTDKADFTAPGKIKVLKSKLLGAALEHWNTYEGGENWENAKQHLLKLFPEVQSYTSVMAKVPFLKREQKEQISQFATRIVKMYDTLQRLHPSGNYHDKVKQSDSIRKLLEVLPLPDRKWIKISDPVANTFWEVLKQILTYVETETSLKLTQEDIDREQKVKSGTYEVNNTQASGSSKQPQNQPTQQVASNEQSSGKANNQGNKQNSNPNAGKTCNYCHNLNHVMSECRKKQYAESNSKNNQNEQQSGYESHTEYNNDNNFKYLLGLSSTEFPLSDRRCFRCNETTHIAKFCQNNNQRNFQ